jgi:hypothetical protein
MTSISDPLLQRVDARTPREPWWTPRTRQQVAVHQDAALPAARTLGARIAARALLLTATALLGLRIVGGWIAEPLAPATSAMPTWNVELASTSTSSTLAFTYSCESGIHLLRIPGRGAEQDRRVIPAKLAAGDLHLVSLGLGSLDVRGKGPVGSPVVSYGATGRIVTVFAQPDASGVRTGW